MRERLSRLFRTATRLCQIGERPDAGRELLFRYLDGTLTPDGIATLNERIPRDQALRREFARLLLNEEQLREIGAP